MRAEEELKLLKQQIGDLHMLIRVSLDLLSIRIDNSNPWTHEIFEIYERLSKYNEKLLELSKGKNEEDKNQLKFFD